MKKNLTFYVKMELFECGLIRICCETPGQPRAQLSRHRPDIRN